MLTGLTIFGTLMVIVHLGHSLIQARLAKVAQSKDLILTPLSSCVCHFCMRAEPTDR
jgi:hypothetical protein